MRSALLVLGLVCASSLVATGCAQQHGYDSDPEPAFSGATPGFGASPGRGISIVDAGPPHFDGDFPAFPIGPLLGYYPDGGYPWWNFVPEGGAFYDAWVPDSGYTFPDAGSEDASTPLPDWTPYRRPGSTLTISGPCPGPSRAQVTGTDCRAVGWQSPACFRTPVDCPALRDDHYCMVLGNGSISYFGTSSGAFCGPRTLPIAKPSSIGHLGGDVYQCVDGSVHQVALSDGAFDVAPFPCAAVFTGNDALYVHGKDTTAVTRFESWADLKNGQGKVIGYASQGAVFAGNGALLVAMFPGLNQVDLMTVDGSRSQRIYLDGFTGQLTGLDISADARWLFVATDEGLWKYKIIGGAPVSRMRMPEHGALSCLPGLDTQPAGPNLVLSPRPGINPPAESDYIVDLDSCTTSPMRDPQYQPDDGGPELLVVSVGAPGNNVVNDVRATAHTLVLHSIAAGVHWQLNVQAGAKLERLILNGAEPSTVTVSGANVMVERYLGNNSLGSPFYSWYEPQGAVLSSRLQALTSRNITEMRGCLGAGSFTISDIAPLCKR